MRIAESGPDGLNCSMVIFQRKQNATIGGKMPVIASPDVKRNRTDIVFDVSQLRGIKPGWFMPETEFGTQFTDLPVQIVLTLPIAP